LAAIYWLHYVRDLTAFSRLNLYARSEASFQQHLYIKLGTYLGNALPNRAQITFVFGDAGGIPYTTGFRFIDPNGLTEPYIAHLFRMPNSPEKTTLFTNYILSWNPDVVVLGYGTVDDYGLIPVISSTHNPFFGTEPIELYEAYKAHTFVYLCTVRAYSDLQIGVRSDSPYFLEISKAFSDYCNTDSGYFLKNGITVYSDQTKVYFPPYQTVATRTN
jgi:hypothetical protein